MSVYTSVSTQDLQDFLSRYDLGELITHKGIAGGITNTNYFVDTTHGRFVLTLFETLQLEELPFFLKLKEHLNRHAVACPAPVAQKNGALVDVLCGKPAAIITCLNGADVEHPNERQCFAVGAMLAKMHLAGQSFPERMDNPRGAAWREASAQRLAGCLSPQDAYLLNNELAHLAACDTDLPQGIIHADLFRDNVLMYYDEVAGFIDFYYACNGTFVYDIAIAVNDWARQHDAYRLNAVLQAAMMAGYESVRPLADAERAALPDAHRAAAVRFWVSRLLDFHFPPEGELTFTKDPNVFRDLLLSFRAA
ncbi:MAG: homoserine kinase [Neisseria sp.]|nr:homoserine kinase [Neisseria sp.]